MEISLLEYIQAITMSLLKINKLVIYIKQFISFETLKNIKHNLKL